MPEYIIGSHLENGHRSRVEKDPEGKQSKIKARNTSMGTILGDLFKEVGGSLSKDLYLEWLELANQKSAEINQAYEAIKLARNEENKP